MADFKTHVEAGAVTGFAVAVISYNWNLIPNAYMAVIVFFATVIGSFLPDMDSGPGVPIKIIFSFYAYFMAAMSLYWMHIAGATLALKIFVPVACFFFVKFMLQDFFKKHTDHRGIFHSLPAYILSFLIALFIASTTKLNIREQFVISFAVSCGYFCHLLLDEIWSIKAVSEGFGKGNKLKFKDIFSSRGLKKSFGTALDLGFNQKEKYPGVICWTAIIVFAILTRETWLELITLIGSGK